MQHVWNSRPGIARDGKREVRRRQRPTLSCERCRRLKVRCDRSQPCAQCVRSKVADSCKYCPFDMPKGSQRGAQKQTPAEPKASVTSSSSLAAPENTSQVPIENTVLVGGVEDTMYETLSLSLPGASIPETSTVSFAEQLEAAMLTGASCSFPELDWQMKDEEFPIQDEKSKKKKKYKFKARGETHWAAYLKAFRAIPSNNMKPVKCDIAKKQKENDDASDLADQRLLAEQRPREFILSIIPSREVADACVENYFCSVERIYRLLHVPSFRRKVRSFWDDDNGNGGTTTWEWDWLAQLLMVIGLGYYSTTSSDADAKQVKRLYKGAEVCLMRASFIMRPTLITIKALCMMVIAKHISAMSCEACDSCGPLMGIAIRHAMAMGLHRDPSSTFGCNGPQGTELPPARWEMRRRIWTTIALIEIQQSIVNGVPPLLRAYDFDVPSPSNVNDEDFDPNDESSGEVIPRPDTEDTDSTFQIILSKSLNPLLEIVAAANLRGVSPSNFDKFMELDVYLRELLAEVAAVRERTPSPLELYQYQNNSNATLDPSQPQACTALQLFSLEMLFRRTLLVLHWRSSQYPDSRQQYPTSYWTSLECALAILVRQRELYDDYSKIWPSTQWFAELWKNDLLLATMTVGIQMCRKDCSPIEDYTDNNSNNNGNNTGGSDGASGIPSSSEGGDSGGTQTLPSPSFSSSTPSFSPSLSPSLPPTYPCSVPTVTPRATILEALKSCRDIWATNLRRSRCQSKAYRVIEEVVRSVEYGL